MDRAPFQEPIGPIFRRRVVQIGQRPSVAVGLGSTLPFLANKVFNYARGRFQRKLINQIENAAISKVRQTITPSWSRPSQFQTVRQSYRPRRYRAQKARTRRSQRRSYPRRRNYSRRQYQKSSIKPYPRRYRVKLPRKQYLAQRRRNTRFFLRKRSY